MRIRQLAGVVAVVAVVAALAVGIGGSVAGEGPFPEPPEMVLRTGGGAEQRGGHGAYCWRGACVDSAGIAYPRPPLTVTPGEPLTLHHDPLGPLARIGWEVFRYEDRVSPGPADGQDWDDVAPVRRDTERRPSGPLDLSDDLPPGRYVIEVFAELRGGGDSQQGFDIVVGAATGSTPVASPAAAGAGT